MLFYNYLKHAAAFAKINVNFSPERNANILFLFISIVPPQLLSFVYNLFNYVVQVAAPVLNASNFATSHPSMFGHSNSEIRFYETIYPIDLPTHDVVSFID